MEVILLPWGKKALLRAVKLVRGILAAQIKISFKLRMLTRLNCGEMQCGKGFYN
jgi:hypothetical protein